MNSAELQWNALAGKRFGLSGFGQQEGTTILKTIETTEAFCRIMPPGMEESALSSFDAVLVNMNDLPTRTMLMERTVTRKTPFLMMGSPAMMLESMPLLQRTSADFLFAESWSREELLMRVMRLTWKAGEAALQATSRTLTKLLIVDDDSAIVALLVNVLKKSGFECHSARDGKVGLEMARQLLPDLMILDVNMPGHNGFQVLKMLRQDSETASIRTMLLTGCEQEADVLRGFGLGTDDYVTKPFNPMEITARVKSLLGRPK